MRRLIALAAVILIVVTATAYHLTRRQPTPIETNVSEEELAAQAIVRVDIPSSLSVREQQGRDLFAEYCAACHGVNASGSENGPPLVHRIYEPGHHGDESFLLAAQRGVRSHHWEFGDMPPREDVTQTEVRVIISYVRALQRANGID